MSTAMVDSLDLLSTEPIPADRSRRSVLRGPELLDTDGPLNSVQERVDEGEAILVQAVKRGEERAFMELVERFHSPLLRVAMTFVHCEAVAEEVVQDTWVAVLEGIHRFEGRSSLKTWIFRILMNRSKTQGVRESRYVEFPGKFVGSDEGGPDSFEDSPMLGGEAWPALCQNMISSQTSASPDQQMLNKELVQQITAGIHLLPAMQRKVIVLRDIEGLESGAVCRLLGISDTNQRVLLHRARVKIRQFLEPYLESPGPSPADPSSLKQCA